MSEIGDLLTSLYGDGRPPVANGLLICAPIHFAIYNAAREYHGRDWRRIKREMRKAEVAARRAEPKSGINRAANPFWNSATHPAAVLLPAQPATGTSSRSTR